MFPERKLLTVQSSVHHCVFTFKELKRYVYYAALLQPLQEIHIQFKRHAYLNFLSNIALSVSQNIMTHD